MSAHNYRIRDATAADMAQVQPLLEHYITQTDLSYEVVVPTTGDLVTRWEMIRAAQLVFLVTEDPTGAIVGWAYFRPFANTIDSAFKYTVVVESWVSPQHLDMGLGTLQKNALLARLRGLEVKEVIVAYNHTMEA